MSVRSAIACAIGFAVAVLSGTMTARNSLAAENAFSNSLPGGYGDFAVAVAPEPGFYARNDLFYFSGDAVATTSDGLVTLEADGHAVLNYLSLGWVSDKGPLGSRFAAGIYVPINYVDVDVTQTSPLGVADIGNDDFGLGDVVAIPASLYWSKDRIHVNLYEAITAPTGGFDADQTVNVGRNYWSFDTVLAMTWLNAESGTEISIVPGLMVNTENTATDYRTGTEFHIDFMVNQFLSESVAVGLNGYYYQQLTRDTGSGAVFGAFKSRSVGLGPAIYWQPGTKTDGVHLIAKWLHDVNAKNRFKNDYLIFTLIKKI